MVPTFTVKQDTVHKPFPAIYRNSLQARPHYASIHTVCVSHQEEH